MAYLTTGKQKRKLAGLEVEDWARLDTGGYSAEVAEAILDGMQAGDRLAALEAAHGAFLAGGPAPKDAAGRLALATVRGLASMLAFSLRRGNRGMDEASAGRIVAGLTWPEFASAAIAAQGATRAAMEQHLAAFARLTNFCNVAGAFVAGPPEDQANQPEPV